MPSVVVSAALLLLVIGILVVKEIRARRAPARFIISLGERARWRTRPRLLQTEQARQTLLEIINVLENAGFGRAQVLLFFGRPTTDLRLEPEQPAIQASQIASLLSTFRVDVRRYRLGEMPLRYH